MLEDAERLIAAWNERQAKRMPTLFSPTIGAAIAARNWYLWVRCPACGMINAVDLRMIERHCDVAVSGLIPALFHRSCRPNAAFAELVRLSRMSMADLCGPSDTTHNKNSLAGKIRDHKLCHAHCVPQSAGDYDGPNLRGVGGWGLRLGPALMRGSGPNLWH